MEEVLVVVALHQIHKDNLTSYIQNSIMSIEHVLLLFSSRNLSDCSTSIFAHLFLGKPNIPELITLWNRQESA